VSVRGCERVGYGKQQAHDLHGSEPLRPLQSLAERFPLEQLHDDEPVVVRRTIDIIDAQNRGVTKARDDARFVQQARRVLIVCFTPHELHGDARVERDVGRAPDGPLPAFTERSLESILIGEYLARHVPGWRRGVAYTNCRRSNHAGREAASVPGAEAA